MEVGDEARAEQCDANRIGHTGRDYPLTPVSVMPSMKTRWARKKMITIGSMKSSAAAIVRFQLTWWIPRNDDSAIESVCESVFPATYTSGP